MTKLPKLPNPGSVLQAKYTAEQMREYARKAEAEEREACAKVCESEWSNVAERMYGKDCAAAIRARGEA